MSLSVSSGRTATSTILKSADLMHIYDAGIAEYTTMDYGKLYIHNGGTANDTTINGGYLYIYRKSIAMDVLGTDDPVQVQAAMDSWEKFDEVAAKAKEKGYYMTASFAETFRAFSTNFSV